MQRIHDTAIIDPKADLAPDVEVGPYSIIGSGVKIGKGTVIGPHVVIHSDTEIGENNKISHGASIGGDPQDLNFKGQKTFVKIGSGNTIREFATIHKATKEGTATTVGDDNFIMAYAHLGHDVKVGNSTILSNAVGVAGHVEIADRAVLSAYVVVHQFSRIGTMAMIGALGRVNQDVLPYTLVEGNPPVTRGLNVVGLRRNGVDSDSRMALKKAYKILCRSGMSPKAAIERIAKELPSDERVKEFALFVEGSKRGFIK